jgi:hypothetical protein
LPSLPAALLSHSGQDATARALAKILAIRKSLGGRPSLTELFPAKPKGMWWKKYRRLSSKTEECLAVLQRSSTASDIQHTIWSNALVEALKIVPDEPRTPPTAHHTVALEEIHVENTGVKGPN